jgi:hypothetical protein
VRQGYAIDDIAEYYKVSLEDVQQALNIDLAGLNPSDDAQRYIEGEFFHRVIGTDEKGFFLTSAPRGRELVMYVEKEGHRPLTKKVKAGEGLYQNLGRISVYAY